MHKPIKRLLSGLLALGLLLAAPGPLRGLGSAFVDVSSQATPERFPGYERLPYEPGKTALGVQVIDGDPAFISYEVPLYITLAVVYHEQADGSYTGEVLAPASDTYYIKNNTAANLKLGVTALDVAPLIGAVNLATYNITKGATDSSSLDPADAGRIWGLTTGSETIKVQEVTGGTAAPTGAERKTINLKLGGLSLLLTNAKLQRYLDPDTVQGEANYDPAHPFGQIKAIAPGLGYAGLENQTPHGSVLVMMDGSPFYQNPLTEAEGRDMNNPPSLSKGSFIPLEKVTALPISGEVYLPRGYTPTASGTGGAVAQFRLTYTITPLDESNQPIYLHYLDRTNDLEDPHYRDQIQKEIDKGYSGSVADDRTQNGGTP